jgi:hypothetical protein
MYSRKVSINQEEKCSFSFPSNICSHQWDTSPRYLSMSKSSPMDNKKSCKTRFPTRPMELLASGSHLMTPWGLSFLFSENKTFLTFAGQICLWFPSKHGTRTLTTWAPLHIQSIASHPVIFFKGGRDCNATKLELRKIAMKEWKPRILSFIQA